MTLALSSSMDPSYWPDSSTFTSANSANSAYNTSSASINANTNSSSLYDIQTVDQNSYVGYSAQSQAQGRSALYPAHQSSRTGNGLAMTGMRPPITTSSSSSLQYALRSNAQQTSLSPFSSGTSLTSLSLSNLSSVSSMNARGDASSLSPLSPFPPSQSHHANAALRTNRASSQAQAQAQAHVQNQNYVRSHEYTDPNYPAPPATSAPVSNIANGTNINNGPGKFNADMNAGLYAFNLSNPSSEYEHKSRHVSTDVHGQPYSGSSRPLDSSGIHSCPRAHAHTHKHRSYSHAYATAHATAIHDKSSSRVHPCLEAKSGARVKTEPDLDNSHSFEHSPELPGEAGGARFVMEHPYPYAYASLGRESRRPASPHSHSGTHSPTDSLGGARGYEHERSHLLSQDIFNGQQVVQPTPHTLTAPLRAVNASAAMKACMGVFRLDPFAQLNGVALRCGFVSEESSFIGKNKGKRRAKGKAKGRKNKGRKRKRGPDSLSSDDGEDEFDESEEEENSNDTLTWDGFPACPLAVDPVLIEFQIYFEGMEVEHDGETGIDAPETIQDEEDMEEFFDVAVRARPYSTKEIDSKGQGDEDTPRKFRLVEDGHGNRYQDIGREHGYEPDLEDRKLGVYQQEQPIHSRPQAQNQARNSRVSGVFEEYLDLDLSIDEVEAEMDEWASEDVSPTTPYALNHNANTNTIVQGQKTGSTRTRTPTLTSVGNSSSSSTVNPDLNTFGSSSGFANDYFGVKSRYFDSSGYMRLADESQPPSGASNPSVAVHPNTHSDVIANSDQSSFTNLASAGTATLQQLRTQAALRAVSAHTQHAQSQAFYKGLPETGSAQRLASTDGGGSTTVAFTPTPASVAAEMQTGLLVGGRAHQHVQQQNRTGSSSPLHPTQGQGQRQGLTGPGIGNVSGAAHVSYTQTGMNSNPSGYAYADYASGTVGSSSGSNSAPVSTSLSGAFNHGGMSVQTLERRWGEVLQRVHG